MNQEKLSEKLTLDLSKDDLPEIKRISDEVVKNSSQEERVDELFFRVITGLEQKFGPDVSPDSLGDNAMTNYLYLVASSKDYAQFFDIFDRQVPVDYESILFKSIELEDVEATQHLLETQPELLNIKLRSTFGKKTMRQFLSKKNWGSDFAKALSKLKPDTNKEPEITILNPCFKIVKQSIASKNKRKAA